MSEPYSLRTLVGPELRDKTAPAFCFLAMAAIAAGSSTATGHTLGLAISVGAIFAGFAALKPIDDRARELESEA